MELLTQGNSAKLYCLNWIDRYAASHPDITILDLGCGKALNFVKLLQKHPHIKYIGLEPSAEACAIARRNMDGLNATIINAYAYDVYSHQVQEKVDIVVSFSVFEHVYRRLAYLRAAKDCMKPEGYFLINYDSGHFIQATSMRERLKNLLGPTLGRLGRERYYQAFVRERDFQDMVSQAGLKVLEQRSFNTRLKGVYKKIPRENQAEFMEKWLDLENWMNELNLPYDDSKASTWFTRNFVLALR